MGDRLEQREPVRNLSDLVRDAALTVPDRTALVDGARTTTWADLESHVQACSRGLAELGVEPGTRVMLDLHNSVGFVIAYFGVLRAGAVAVPVNTGYTPAEVRRVLDDCGVDVAIVHEDVAQTVTTAVDDSRRAVRTVTVSGSGDPSGSEFGDMLDLGRRRLAEAADASPSPPDSDAESLAVLIYTAGTFGLPKGAMLTHRALLANLDQCMRLDPPPVSGDDVVLLALPLFHIYGLNGALGMVARTGATGVLTSSFDPVATLDLIRRTGVTNVPGAPPMYTAWAEQHDAADACANVRTFVSGAAPLPPPTLEFFRSALGRQVHEGYGLTETAPVVTTTLASRVCKPGSVGTPVPGVEVVLLDEDGEAVEPGDPGEIHVRGANVFSGYWPDGTGGADEHGWYATGDLALADEDGDLFLCGRLKEMVLVSGFNVYPREVEEVLASHPAVAEAAVVGLADARTGEAVKAVVVPVAGEHPTTAELRAYCGQRLARFKLPTVVELVESLPHSVTGKVAKGLLTEAEQPVGPTEASA